MGVLSKLCSFGRLYFLLIFIIWSFNSCSPEENSSVSEEVIRADEIVYDYSLLELELLDIVNSHRGAIGLNELQILDAASVQAASHSEHMVKTGEVCHHDFGQRLKNLRKNVGAKAMGENVGYGFNTANSLVMAWLKSEGHGKIIEGESSHFGVAARLNGEEKVYVTMIFIKK